MVYFDSEVEHVVQDAEAADAVSAGLLVSLSESAGLQIRDLGQICPVQQTAQPLYALPHKTIHNEKTWSLPRLLSVGMAMKAFEYFI